MGSSPISGTSEALDPIRAIGSSAIFIFYLLPVIKQLTEIFFSYCKFETIYDIISRSFCLFISKRGIFSGYIGDRSWICNCWVWNYRF